jgi:hypothetical protein
MLMNHYYLYPSDKQSIQHMHAYFLSYKPLFISSFPSNINISLSGDKHIKQIGRDM